MMIYVFETDTGGRHVGATAMRARAQHGAQFGIGEGLQGQSYAIPTRDHNLRPLPLEQIRAACRRFTEFARGCPHLTFSLMPVGCIDGTFIPEQIAPFFDDAPANVDIPFAFDSVLQGFNVTMLEERRRRALDDAAQRLADMAAQIPPAGVPGMPLQAEAVCALMAAAYTLLRDMEGDEFVHGWLGAAQREMVDDFTARQAPARALT